MKKPTVISIFAGCGGSSFGYKMAGYKELLAIDFDNNSVETFRLNFPNIPCWQRDIRTITGKEIMEFCNIKKGELDILDGSPPCQGFSTAGKRNINDNRNNLFLEFVRLIKELQPKIFIMENVSGQVKGKMKGMFKEIIITLKKLNYNVKCKLLNAANYNVPQSRQRLFYIGVRKDLNKEPVFPKPTGKVITVREALKKCPKTNEIKKYTGKWLHLIPIIKQGKSMADIHPKGHGFNLRKLTWNKPSPTVLKTFNKNMTGLLHPEENRFLTIPELKRICSFPDWFKFIGKFEDKWARMGNAVMPNQMKAIAETIKNKILDELNE